MDYFTFYLKHGGERVLVVTNDGERFKGILEDYTSDLDNDPEPESITIGDVELYTSDVSKIELLGKK